MGQSTAEELGLQLDENFDLLWSLIFRVDDGRDRSPCPRMVKQHSFVERPSVLVTPAGPPVYAKCSDVTTFLGRHVPTQRDAECAVCGDVTFIVANAAAWRLPLTGEVILNALRRWHFQNVEAETLGRQYLEEDGVPVPLCQICVDLLVDTEDLERRLVDGEETLSGVPEDLKPKLSLTEEEDDVKPDLREEGQDVSLVEEADVKPHLQAFASSVGVEDGGEDPLSLTTSAVQKRAPKRKPKRGKRGKRSAAANRQPGERKPKKLRPQGEREWSLPTYEVQRPHLAEEDENTEGLRRSRRTRRTLAVAPIDDEIFGSDDEEPFAEDAEEPASMGVAEKKDDDDWDASSEDRESTDDDEEEEVDDEEEFDEIGATSKVPVGSETWFRPVCRLCDAEFPNHTLLAEHFSQIHRESKFPYVCHFCLVGFVETDEFSCHVMCEELQRESECEFRCGVCGEDCVNPRLLAIHFAENHTEGDGSLPFPCAECPRSFSSYVRFVEHRGKAHDAEVRPASAVPLSSAFECPSCRLVFPSSSRLGAHLLGVEFDAEKVCDACGLRFDARAAREAHEVAAHGATKKRRRAERARDGRGGPCPICGKHSYHIPTHVRKVHTKEKVMACSVCDEKFTYKHQVVEHEVEVHGVGVERHQLPCPECSKTFKTAPYRRKHMFAVHGVVPKGHKVFPCHLCDKKFLEDWRLRAHVDSHEGNKRHWCPKCEHRTVSFVNLQTHLKWKHRVLVKKVLHKLAKFDDELGSSGYDIVELGPWEPPKTSTTTKRKKKMIKSESAAGVGKENVGEEDGN